MILLGRLVGRLVAFVLFLALAAAGLAVAVFSIDTGRKGASLGDLARQLHLPAARREVGHWLMRLEHGGPIALGAAACGLGAMLVGVLILLPYLGHRRERLVLLEDSGGGTLAARRKALAAIAQTLAEQAHGVTEAKARIRGTRTRSMELRVRATHPRHSLVGDVERGLHEQLAELTEPFGLHERSEIDREGRRVQ